MPNRKRTPSPRERSSRAERAPQPWRCGDTGGGGVAMAPSVPSRRPRGEHRAETRQRVEGRMSALACGSPKRGGLTRGELRPRAPGFGCHRDCHRDTGRRATRHDGTCRRCLWAVDTAQWRWRWEHRLLRGCPTRVLSLPACDVHSQTHPPTAPTLHHGASLIYALLSRSPYSPTRCWPATLTTIHPPLSLTFGHTPTAHPRLRTLLTRHTWGIHRHPRPLATLGHSPHSATRHPPPLAILNRPIAPLTTFPPRPPHSANRSRVSLPSLHAATGSAPRTSQVQASRQQRLPGSHPHTVTPSPPRSLQTDCFFLNFTFGVTQRLLTASLL
ncbi:uncharacterized protein LOC144945712 [Lampetra fluviatilis]